MEKYDDSVRLVIKCNRTAADSMVPLLKEFRFMGNAGCSRSVTIEDYSDHRDHDHIHRFGFDGDGPDRIDSIELDGELIKAKYIAKVPKPGGGFNYIYPHPKTGRPTLYEDVGGKIEIKESRPARDAPKKKVKAPTAAEAKDIRGIARELRAIGKGKVLRMHKDPKKHQQAVKGYKKELINTLNKYKSKYGEKILVSMGVKMEKAKRMAIGTVSHGRKKVAEGKWVPVSGKEPAYSRSGMKPTEVKERIAQLQKRWRSTRVSARVSAVPGQYKQLEQIEKEIKELGGKIPVVSKKKKKVSRSGQAGTLPLDVHTLTEASATSLVKQCVKMPLKTLRRNQDIVEQQKEKAYEKKNYKALDRLEVMGDIYTAGVMVKEFKDSTPKEWGEEIVGRISRMGKSIEETKMNLVVPIKKACATATKEKLKKADVSKPDPKDFKNKFDYYKALMKWKTKNKTEKSIVLMPTEMLKAKHLNKVGSRILEHKGKVKSTGNARGTVAPKEPQGSRGSKPSKGASHPESSKTGGSPSRVSGRKAVKPPYKGEVWRVGGMRSDASGNHVILTSKDGKKTGYLKLGTKHKAEFDHAGNIIRIKVDAKSYPVQNHLVKVPRGVFKIAGSPSVANTVVGAKK